MRHWRSNKKLLSICTASLFLWVLLIFLFYPEKINYEYHATFDYDCPQNDSAHVDYTTHRCIRGPHIFFAETSGSNVLTVRQACAVESTARHNPSMSALALMTPQKSINMSHPLLSKLSSLPNLQFMKIDFDVFVHGTPIWTWLRAGKWKKSQWKVSHLSDALRFLLVWKYGGMYLDLDIVTLRSLESLKNSVITEDWNRVAAGILIFSKGHELMWRSMLDFASNYDPFNFVNNGPGVITRNIHQLCDMPDTGKISGVNCDVNILPPEAAFPIPYDEWERYFSPSQVRNAQQHFNSSFLIHVWNKYSRVEKLKVGTNSLYELAMKQNCPLSYEYAQSLVFI